MSTLYGIHIFTYEIIKYEYLTSFPFPFLPQMPFENMLSKQAIYLMDLKIKTGTGSNYN